MPTYKNKSTDRLFKVLSQIDNPKDICAFLEDLCTIKEIQDMAQRLDTAILLDEGMNYQKIAEKVGTSTATISRVSRCLSYGAGGYRKVLDKLKEESAEKEKKTESEGK